MIKCLVFDLDGTLVDTLKDLAVTCNELLVEYGYESIEVSEYNMFVGNGIKKLVERALKRVDGDLNLLDEIFNKFIKSYSVNYLRYSKVYDGCLDLLNYLKENQYLLFVNTNKNNEIANDIINSLLPNYFIATYGDSINYPKKPDPFILSKIKKEYNLKDNEILMVGDSDIDIMTAKKADVKSIGCIYGFRGEKELLESGANYLINSPLEIIGLLKKINCKIN